MSIRETVTILGLHGKTRPLVRIEREQQPVEQGRPRLYSFWEATAAATAGSPAGGSHIVRSDAGQAVGRGYPQGLEVTKHTLRTSILGTDGRVIQSSPSWAPSVLHDWPEILAFGSRALFIDPLAL